MEQWAAVDRSGNSNVMVYVDTTAIAYAMVSCLAATGQLNAEDVKNTIQQLNTMLQNDQNRQQFFKAIDPRESIEDRGFTRTPNEYAAPVKRIHSSRSRRS